MKKIYEMDKYTRRCIFMILALVMTIAGFIALALNTDIGSGALLIIGFAAVVVLVVVFACLVPPSALGLFDDSDFVINDIWDYSELTRAGKNEQDDNEYVFSLNKMYSHVVMEDSNILPIDAFQMEGSLTAIKLGWPWILVLISDSESGRLKEVHKISIEAGNWQNYVYVTHPKDGTIWYRCKWGNKFPFYATEDQLYAIVDAMEDGDELADFIDVSDPCALTRFDNETVGGV